jgi:uncharacterized protein YndB with AHSA1/START domain
MIDIINEISAIRREVGVRLVPEGEARVVSLRRGYDADIDDVWDAVTNPDRLARWFLPVTGDFQPGGKYQVQGNAGGEILRCEPPKLLKVTWIFGEPGEGDISEVEVRLSTGDGGGTVFELEHTATVDAQRWADFGPGAVGVGWDLTLLGLGLHLRTGGGVEDPTAWESSPEARQFQTESSRAWGAAHEASGATPEEAAVAAEGTRKFYVPDQDPTPPGAEGA